MPVVPADRMGTCPMKNPSFISTTTWLSYLFLYSASSISSFPMNGIQVYLIIPVAAWTCHCSYKLSSNYFVNKLIKNVLLINAGLILTPGLRDHERIKCLCICLRKHSMHEHLGVLLSQFFHTEIQWTSQSSVWEGYERVSEYSSGLFVCGKSWYLFT